MRKFSAFFVGNILGRLAVVLIVARVFLLLSQGGGILRVFLIKQRWQARRSSVGGKLSINLRSPVF